MCKRTLRGISGIEKFPDDVRNPISDEGFVIHDWDKLRRDNTVADCVLLDIEYTFGMFTVECVIEEGQPITLRLTETPQHLAKRLAAPKRQCDCIECSA